MSGADPRPLAGLRVIVTRPAHQSEALCQQLEANGAEAVRLPLFAIDPIGDGIVHTETLARALDWDGWIFTSGNAARLAAERLPGPWPALFAVGRSTAAVLAELGHAGARAPELNASSESLLELPELKDVSGKRLLVVTGDAGRGLIEDTLAARGATVETLPLYRRRPLEYAANRLASEMEMAEVSILTSGEALDRLWQLTPRHARPALLRQQLVVPSRRVLEQAAERGFNAPLVPADVSDDAIVRCLIEWRALAASNDAMTEPTPAEPELPPTPAPTATAVTPPAAPPSRSRGRAGAVLAWLLVVGLLGALGYGGWLFWDLRQNQMALLQMQDHALRRLATQAEDLENQAAQLATRQSDMARVVQRTGSDMAAIQGRLDDSQQVMGRLTEELQGGRTRFQLVSVEHLLLLANDRLLLERDVRGALLALEIADGRLGELNDPRLFKVREAIAEERAKLQALPRPDLTSASLSLSSLIDRSASLPLKSRASPTRRDRKAEMSAAHNGYVPAWPQRVWASVKQAVSSLFLLRRADDARTRRMLPQEDEAVIYHVLALRLESARVALLRGDGQAFREATRSAGDWLREFFRPEDGGVASALAELDRLQPLEVAAPAPDITRSLGLLRAHLEAPAQ